MGCGTIPLGDATLDVTLAHAAVSTHGDVSVAAAPLYFFLCGFFFIWRNLANDDREASFTTCFLKYRVICGSAPVRFLS